MTINFPLASNFPLTPGNLVFIVLLGSLRALGVHAFPFPPVDSYLNLDYDHKKNLLGKLISRAICYSFKNHPNFHLTHIIKVALPLHLTIMRCFR